MIKILKAIVKFILRERGLRAGEVALKSHFDR
jgi:hypothetical protein